MYGKTTPQEKELPNSNKAWTSSKVCYGPDNEQQHTSYN